MSRLVRLVLACLLALALPLQGAAGVLGLHCQGHDGTETPCAAHATAHSHESMAEAQLHQPDGPGAAGVDDAGVCSACAACCAASALPPQVLRWAAPQLQPQPAVALRSATATFLTGGPERPPRPMHV